MKHWKTGKTNEGCGVKGLLLKAKPRILSVAKTKEGIVFREECDGYFSHIYTKEEALELLTEIQDWIKST